MADFRNQLLNLLSSTGGNSLIQTESTVNERTIPTENGSNIVFQQRREVEREIKKVQPQLDFTSEDFCAGESIKLINKLQLLPAIPYNILKLEYRTIRNARCLIATAQANFGDAIEGHEDFPPIIEMTISNKWSKLFAPLIGTSDAKYIIATRCNMVEEQTFNDKKYATMKFEFAKTILKKYMSLCDDETVVIDCEKPNLYDEKVKRAVRRSSDLLSRSTYEIHRRNLIWDEDKYNEAMSKASKTSLKRKLVVEAPAEIIKKTVEVENVLVDITNATNNSTVDLEDVE